MLPAYRVLFLSSLVPLWFSLVRHFAIVHCDDIVIFFPFPIKSFCRQGSVSELLLSLLSSWTNSVSRRPAVAHVKSAPVSAVTVCVLVACPLPRSFCFLCHECIGAMITVEKSRTRFWGIMDNKPKILPTTLKHFYSIPCHVIVLIFVFGCYNLFGWLLISYLIANYLQSMSWWQVKLSWFLSFC